MWHVVLVCCFALLIEEKKKASHIQIKFNLLRTRKYFKNTAAIKRRSLLISGAPNFYLDRGHPFGTSFEPQPTPLS